MKARKVLSLILLFALVLSLGAYAANHVDASERTENPILLDISGEYTADRREEIAYSTDREGNLYGPADFAVDNGTVYLLDTAENRVYVYENGANRAIALQDYGVFGTMLAVADGTVYVLGNNFDVLVLADGAEGAVIDISSIIGAAAVLDFNAIKDALYISLSDNADGTTRKLVYEDGAFRVAETYSGFVFDEETVYKAELLKTGGALGHGCILTVANVDGEILETIEISSPYWVYGADYLGKDAGGRSLVKLFELATETDYTVKTAESILLIDENGSVLSQEALPTQRLNNSNLTKAVDGKAYHLTAAVDRITVAELDAPNAAEQYVSPLAEISEPAAIVEQTNALPTVLGTISRVEVLQIADTYHTDFSWTCTAANLASLTNWTKPRYVSGAGTYTCMPYCWGKWNSPSEFTTGLSNGGRVGNISTTFLASTYGVDCSGFVSRCWNLDQRYYTGSLPSLCSQLTYSSLQDGDLLNKHVANSDGTWEGHAILFEKVQGSVFVCYESTTLNSYDRVAHTTRTPSSLQGSYVALRYKNITDFPEI